MERRRVDVALIATALRDELAEQQKTSSDLAAVLGVATAEVDEWLDAVKSPNTEELDGICVFFEIPFPEFIARIRVAA